MENHLTQCFQVKGNKDERDLRVNAWWPVLPGGRGG